MKEKLRKNKGITLITLVIIIVVLIILAGVAINLALGENGIIKKARNGVEKQEIAQIKEKMQLEIASAETDAIIRGESLEKMQLNEIIAKYGELQEDEDTIITKEKKYKISLKEVWYGVISNSGSYTDKVEQIKQLEDKLVVLQKKYDDLEELNSGNSQIITNLNNEIETSKNTLSQYKTVIAEAITKQGIKTSLDATSAVMAENISKILQENALKILQEKTKDATATADNITEGKTAYVNGTLITGNGNDNKTFQNQVTKKFENITVSNVNESTSGTYSASLSQTFTEDGICGVGYHNGNSSFSVAVTKNGKQLDTTGFWSFGLYKNPTKLIGVTAGDTISITVSGGVAGQYDYYKVFICNFNIT